MKELPKMSKRMAKQFVESAEVHNLSADLNGIDPSVEGSETILINGEPFQTFTERPNLYDLHKAHDLKAMLGCYGPAKPKAKSAQMETDGDLLTGHWVPNSRHDLWGSEMAAVPIADGDLLHGAAPKSSIPTDTELIEEVEWEDVP